MIARRKSQIAKLFLCMIPLSGCAGPHRDDVGSRIRSQPSGDRYDDPPSATEIERRDPAADVARAIGRHDLRFVSTMGLGIGVPGLPDNLFERYTDRFGTKNIGATSDATDLYTVYVSDEYAKIYNSILLRHLRLNHIADPYAEMWSRPTTAPASQSGALPRSQR